MKRWLWVAGVVLVGCVVAIVAWRYTVAERNAVVEYKTATVKPRRVAASVTASGTLSARVTVQVGSQVSGRVQELFADYNSQVKKGQLIARIDPQILQANLDQANANYLAAKAQVAKADVQSFDADRQWNRNKALLAQNLASQTDLETAETTARVAKVQVDVAKAAREQARASLTQAQVNLSYTKILSPIDGIVISRSVDVGQTVAASLSAPVLFTIAEDLRKMQVDTSVAEGDVGRLEQGMSATFTVDAFPGQKFNGVISMIRNAPQTVQNVVTYDAVLSVDNADLRLRPGMTANITVAYATRESVLAVPNSALRFRMPNASVPTDSTGRPGSSATASDSTRNARAEHTVHQHRDAGAGDSDAGPGAPVGDSASRVAGPQRRIYLLTGTEARAVMVTAGLSDGSYTEISGDIRDGDEAIIDVGGGRAGAASANATTNSPFGGGGGGGGGGGARRSPF